MYDTSDDHEEGSQIIDTTSKQEEMPFGEAKEDVHERAKVEDNKPIMRIEMREEIDSEDSYWKLLARPDNPIKQCRRKIKSLRKQLRAQE